MLGFGCCGEGNDGNGWKWREEGCVPCRAVWLYGALYLSEVLVCLLYQAVDDIVNYTVPFQPPAHRHFGGFCRNVYQGRLQLITTDRTQVLERPSLQIKQSRLKICLKKGWSVTLIQLPQSYTRSLETSTLQNTSRKTL